MGKEKFGKCSLIMNSIALPLKNQHKGSTNNHNILHNVLPFHGKLKRKAFESDFGKNKERHNSAGHVKE